MTLAPLYDAAAQGSESGLFHFFPARFKTTSEQRFVRLPLKRGLRVVARKLALECARHTAKRNSAIKIRARNGPCNAQSCGFTGKRLRIQIGLQFKCAIITLDIRRALRFLAQHANGVLRIELYFSTRGQIGQQGPMAKR